MCDPVRPECSLQGKSGGSAKAPCLCRGGSLKSPRRIDDAGQSATRVRKPAAKETMYTADRVTRKMRSGRIFQALSPDKVAVLCIRQLQGARDRTGQPSTGEHQRGDTPNH